MKWYTDKIDTIKIYKLSIDFSTKVDCRASTKMVRLLGVTQIIQINYHVTERSLTGVFI